MDLRQFFQPVDINRFTASNIFTGDYIGNYIHIHEEEEVPKVEKNDLVLIGIKTSPEDDSPDWIRKYFYSLKLESQTAKIIDGGDYVLDKNDEHHLSQMSFGLSEIIDGGACPMLIGGSHEVTYLQYLAYESLKKMANLVLLDSKADFSISDKESPLKSDTYLRDILTRENPYLFNLSLIGYQYYLVGNGVYDTLNRMYFDLHRLGEARENLKNIEPVIRNGDFLSFDIGSIRQSDAPGSNNPSPNGFYGEEACLLARYAGLSNKMSSIGFYEYNPAFDNYGQTAHLVAQIMWYFMEGYMNRYQEHPHENEEDFYKYITNIKDQSYKIVFFKSKKTDRWWMEVPVHIHDPRYQNQAVIPCSYDDYLAATQDEIPERWWQALQKLS